MRGNSLLNFRLFLEMALIQKPIIQGKITLEVAHISEILMCKLTSGLVMSLEPCRRQRRKFPEVYPFRRPVVGSKSNQNGSNSLHELQVRNEGAMAFKM